MLEIKVFGRQDLPDQSLVESGDVAWRIDGEGTLREPDAPSSNGVVDDVVVLYIAPNTAGRHSVTASVHDCLGRRVGETDDSVEARCSAEFSIQVLRSVRSVTTPTAVPVNPAGPIPVVIPGVDGTQHSVFTPEEGGEAESADGSCTLRLPVGAVANGEYVGAAIAVIEGELSDGRFAVRGALCEVSVVDSSGVAVESYLLEDPAEICMPVPPEFRSRIVDVEMAVVEDVVVSRLVGSTIRLVGRRRREIPFGGSGGDLNAGDRRGGCTVGIVAAGSAGDMGAVTRFAGYGRLRAELAERVGAVDPVGRGRGCHLSVCPQRAHEEHEVKRVVRVVFLTVPQAFQFTRDLASRL